VSRKPESVRVWGTITISEYALGEERPDRASSQRRKAFEEGEKKIPSSLFRARKPRLRIVSLSQKRGGESERRLTS